MALALSLGSAVTTAAPPAAALPAVASADARLRWDIPLDWGPLDLRSRAPVFDNRLSYTPGRVGALPRHTWELNATFSHVNIWAQMPAYFFDGEWSRFDLKIATGVGADTEISIDFGLLRRSGGYMDRFIETFHSLMGITQARRLNYPNDTLRVATGQGDAQRIWLNDAVAGTGIANPVLAAKKTLLAPVDGAPRPAIGRWPTVAADFAIKLPLGHIGSQYATARTTLLADLAVQQPITRWLQLYVTYGLMLSPGIAHLYGMPLSEVQKFLSLATVFRLATHWTLSVQYLNQDGSVETADFVPMERTTHEFGLGVKWAPGATDRWVLQAGLIENTVHDANTPDFGFSFGVRTKL